jgi:uncharacterized protein (DUF983 family)
MSENAISTAARGLCPRCHERTLFAGPIQFAPACRACRLDFAGFNVGDGPAAFLIFGVGGLITGLAIWLELRASPPWWLHLLLWLPLAILLTIGGLRIAKAWLLTIEYRRSAREAGRRDAR